MATACSEFLQLPRPCPGTCPPISPGRDAVMSSSYSAPLVCWHIITIISTNAAACGHVTLCKRGGGEKVSNFRQPFPGKEAGTGVQKTCNPTSSPNPDCPNDPVGPTTPSLSLKFKSGQSRSSNPRYFFFFFSLSSLSFFVSFFTFSPVEFYALVFSFHVMFPAVRGCRFSNFPFPLDVWDGLTDRVGFRMALSAAFPRRSVLSV